MHKYYGLNFQFDWIVNSKSNAESNPNTVLIFDERPDSILEIDS